MKKIIITDLDGSLLSHSYFSFKQIHSDILNLLDAGILVIPASSKTKVEMEMFCAELGRNLPFIYENGAGFQNVQQFTSEKSLKSFILSEAALDCQKIWEIWCEFVSEELKTQCLFAHEMTLKQQVEVFGLTGRKLDNALDREYSLNFKFSGDETQLQLLIKILSDRNLVVQQGGRLMTLSGKHNKADYCNFIRSKQKSFGFKSFLVGVGDSENDIDMLEKCDIACIIPRPHKSLLSISTPIERTIVAGNIAPLGWLEAVRKAISLNQEEETLCYG